MDSPGFAVSSTDFAWIFSSRPCFLWFHIVCTISEGFGFVPHAFHIIGGAARKEGVRGGGVGTRMMRVGAKTVSISSDNTVIISICFARVKATISASRANFIPGFMHF